MSWYVVYQCLCNVQWYLGCDLEMKERFVINSQRMHTHIYTH